MEVKKIGLDPALAQMMQAFASADLRHEVLITAILDVLTSKKDEKGEPIVTREEIEEKAVEIQNKIIQETKIAKPNKPGIILPKDS